MRRALGAGMLTVLFTALAIAGCAVPEGGPPGAVQAAVSEVGSAEARQVVDKFLAAVSAGDAQAAGALLAGEAIETSRTMLGASAVELLSVTEVPGAGGADESVHVFDVECEMSYPDKSTLSQSGVYVYRMRVARTAEGLRIEKLGP